MTGRAIGEVLAFGVGVALSPLAIVALVVMLVSPNGSRSALAFAVGWVLSLALLCTVVLLLADGADASEHGTAATWVSLVKILAASLLVIFAVRQWRRRETGQSGKEAPGWLRRLDNVGAAKAASLAVLFNVAKPKNMLLTIGAGVSVAQVGASPAGQASAVGAFVLLGSAGLAVPLAIRLLMPSRGADALTGLRDWMVEENATIIAVLSLVIAAKLLGDALISLAG